MRIFNFKKIENFIEKHADSKTALLTWYRRTLKARWENTNDIKAQYASASFLKNNRIVFNIKGNKYRLVVDVFYKEQYVIIFFVGTHEEYNKIKFE